MKAEEKELIKKIVEISTLIQEKYPELVYELEEYNYYTGADIELSAKDPRPEENIGALASYLNSLKTVLKKYISEKNKKDLYLINHL